MNYVFRQGYATPYFRGAHQPTPSDVLAPGGKSILLRCRCRRLSLPNVHSFDGRLGWAWRYKARYGVNFDLDIFNMFNNSTILGRQIDSSTTATFNQPREIMNPRIFRLGARFNF